MRATFTHLSGSRKGDSDRFVEERISVGRAPDNIIVFGDSDRRVSAHHAEIRQRGDQYILRDLGSTNGTMVNGRRVMTTELQPDDLVEFGAGGPIIRFGIERDGVVAPTEEVEAPLLTQSTTEQLALHNITGQMSKSLPRSRAKNTWLIAAVVVAMIAGAAGGIWLASRIEASRIPSGFAGVAERNSPAVVFIRAEFTLADAQGQIVMTEARTGTGFVISADGLIVTNRHLIRDWEYNPHPGNATGQTTKIEVVFPGKRREDAMMATVHKLSDSPETDIAILRITPPPEIPVIQGMELETGRINQGEDIAVIGYPLGMDLLNLTGTARVETSLSTGVVSRVTPSMIQLNIRAYQGNSGGPVLNRRGRVIGILTANVGTAQDITLCTPIGLALELIDSGRGSRSRLAGL